MQKEMEGLVSEDEDDELAAVEKHLGKRKEKETSGGGSGRKRETLHANTG